VATRTSAEADGLVDSIFEIRALRELRTGQVFDDLIRVPLCIALASQGQRETAVSRTSCHLNDPP
jgi:hypothetical protein